MTPAPKRSGLRLSSALLGVHILCNGAGIVLGAGYVWLVTRPLIATAFPETSWIAWMTALSAITTVVVGTVILALVWPVLRAVEAQDREDPVDPALEALAVRRLSNAPLQFSLLGLGAWIFAAASLPVVFHGADEVLWRLVIVHGVATVGLMGLIAFSTEIHVLEWFVQERVIGRRFRHVDVAAIPGIWSLPLGIKLTGLMVINCALPVGVLTLSHASGHVTLTGSLYIAATFILLGAVQGYFLARNVNNKLLRLERGMARIGEDDLDVRLPVLSGDRMGRVLHGFNTMSEGLRRSEYIKATFGQYVSPAVVQKILAGEVSLVGEERFATVLFTDLRDFTPLCETLRPAEVVAFLNDFLDRMVGILIDHGGTIDKFIGDSIMATFGVPTARSPEEDARAAARAALRMIEEMDAWNEARAGLGQAAVRIGIGIHSGEVVAGNIGSKKKLEYTVIGDAVNTASRIEQLTKSNEGSLLASAATVAFLGEAFSCEPLPPVAVKGKREPLRVYRVVGLAKEPADRVPDVAAGGGGGGGG